MPRPARDMPSSQLPSGPLGRNVCRSATRVHRMPSRLTASCVSTLARMTEHDAKDMATSPLAVGPMDRRPAAEIHLCFFSGSALHAPEGQRLAALQTPHKTTHARILAGKAVV